MAKTLVTNLDSSTPVPFLRGMLTRSLQDAGLSFEQSYEVASVVRDELAETAEISADNLRDTVIGHLERSHGSALARRYEQLRLAPATIMVRCQEEHLTPFSRAQHQRGLEACGLSSEEAMVTSARMYDQLLKDQVNEIRSRDLSDLTYRCLRRDFGLDVAYRYLVWTDFQQSGRPLLLLLGGTSGCGKSTVATELANRLQIVRSQSTDMLREVMRIMIPQRLLPVLHTSSFSAWKALPSTGDEPSAPEALLTDGYSAQSELLSVACEAVVQRALQERVSLLLEGVHVNPSFVEKIPREDDAVIVPVMLAVLKPEQLRTRIRGRALNTPQRKSERYLENFDAIWRLQSHLLSEADRLNMPIVVNDDIEKVRQRVMAVIIDRLTPEYSRSGEPPAAAAAMSGAAASAAPQSPGQPA